jgi:hypothetical protein
MAEGQAANTLLLQFVTQIHGSSIIQEFKDFFMNG